ncbi:hypothetical protein Tco_1433885, partial [Tanacetum coccineum]
MNLGGIRKEQKPRLYGVQRNQKKKPKRVWGPVLEGKKVITGNEGGWGTKKFVNLKQASIALKQGKSMIIAGLAESKKDHAIELLAKLEVGMNELQKITEDRKREVVVPKQKESL